MHATVKSADLKRTIFRIVPVKLYANGRVVETNAFLDEGSAPTLMTKELASKLGVSGQKSDLHLSWTDGQEKVEKDSENVAIEISGVDADSQKYNLKNVKTVSKSHLDLPLPTQNLKELQNKCQHLKDIRINQPFNRKPELLIGLEHSKLGVSRQMRDGSWSEPIGTLTRLGWVIHGKSNGTLDNEKSRQVCAIFERNPMKVVKNLEVETENWAEIVKDTVVDRKSGNLASEKFADPEKSKSLKGGVAQMKFDRIGPDILNASSLSQETRWKKSIRWQDFIVGN
jgi:hypothetical protein